MSIFGSIMHKIFGSSAASAATPAASAAGDVATSASGDSAQPGTAAGAVTAGPPVDVVEVLTNLSSQNGQSLNWQKSIVDLMKLLGLDSSLDSRKLLADELGYTGDTNDSATMNVWLHKQVMVQLAENGGVVPDSLRA